MKDNKIIQEAKRRDSISIYESRNAEENSDNFIDSRSLRKNFNLSYKKIFRGGQLNIYSHYRDL